MGNTDLQRGELFIYEPVMQKQDETLVLCFVEGISIVYGRETEL